jgi:hypothetical protein
MEGDWEFYSASPQRAAKKAADTPSYVWDQLIEYQSSFIRAGTAISLPELDVTPSDHERIVRALADESRLSRRQLAAHFWYALSQSNTGKKFARIVTSRDRPERAYVFLTTPKPINIKYAEYREMRIAALITYCHGVKLKFSGIVEVVGIASEPFTESLSSQDFIYISDFGDNQCEAQEIATWSDAMAELDVLQSPTVKVIEGEDHEFPLPFNFSQGPEFYSADNGMPMNRAARRATAKRRRKKQH